MNKEDSPILRSCVFWCEFIVFRFLVWPLVRRSVEAGVRAVIREFKKQGRRRQRIRRKTMGLMSNRSARAFYSLVHFFTVLAKQQREMTKI